MRKRLIPLVLLALLLLAGCGAAGPQPTLLYFYKEGCPACERIEPVVATVQEKYDDKIIYKQLTSQTEEGKELGQQYGIDRVPTFVALDADGGEVGRLIGAQTSLQDFDELLEHAGVKK